jgi:hypothetical protein
MRTRIAVSPQKYIPPNSTIKNPKNNHIMGL